MSSLQTVNPRVRDMRVSPHTILQTQAHRLRQELTQGAQRSFTQVIDLTSGDPHQAGIKFNSFVRQVLAVCLCPQLLEDELLPSDVRLRAQSLLDSCDGGSVGAYSPSAGLTRVRQSIAQFITRRDGGIRSNSEDVYISAGSQVALRLLVKLLAGGAGDTSTGVLVPVPSPHSLPVLLDQEGVIAVPYLLVEEDGWALHLDQLQGALAAARGQCNPRAIYISNPGNPTGHVQDRRSIEKVIRFAAAERLLLLVDEVFQDCVFDQDTQFLSYKKVLCEMEPELSNLVELVSFHSLSSGSIGEGGLRGGFMEAVNIDPDVRHFVETMLCFDISAPVTGQLALDLMVNPPKPGDTSHLTYTQESLHSLAILSHNSQRAWQVLNTLPGVSCQLAKGGIFLYPGLTLPAGLVEQAQLLGLEADVLYCQRLLQEEGVLLGAGGRYGDRFHLRLCFLVPSETLDQALRKLCSFHLRLISSFTSPREQTWGRAQTKGRAKLMTSSVERRETKCPTHSNHV